MRSEVERLSDPTMCLSLLRPMRAGGGSWALLLFGPNNKCLLRQSPAASRRHSLLPGQRAAHGAPYPGAQPVAGSITSSHPWIPVYPLCTTLSDGCGA